MLLLQPQVVEQYLKRLARLLQQQCQALVQALLAIGGWRHAVEAHQGVQAQARQGLPPGQLARRVDRAEVEHRQQRLATQGEDGQFIAVLGQHRLAGVDDIQPGIGTQQLAQHLGFLLETLACFAAVKEAADACRAVLARCLSGLAVEQFQQGDGVLHAGGVVQLQ